jgi:hypothetical protein
MTQTLYAHMNKRKKKFSPEHVKQKNTQPNEIFPFLPPSGRSDTSLLCLECWCSGSPFSSHTIKSGQFKTSLAYMRFL